MRISATGALEESGGKLAFSLKAIYPRPKPPLRRHQACFAQRGPADRARGVAVNHGLGNASFIAD